MIAKVRLRLIVAMTVLFLLVASWQLWDGSTSGIVSTVLMLVILVITTRISLTRKRKQLATYQLFVTEDTFTRELDGMPSITIRRDEIRQIINVDDGISIVGESKLNAIGIPKAVSDFHELQRELHSVMPFSNKGVMALNIFAWVAMAVMLAALLLTLHEDAITAMTGSAVALVLLTWGWVFILRGKNIEKRIKRLSWIIVIPWLSILAWFVARLMDLLGTPTI